MKLFTPQLKKLVQSDIRIEMILYQNDQSPYGE